jgi:hypothetical protein
MRAITGLLRLFSAVIVIAAIAVGLSLMLSTKGTGPEIDPRLSAVVEEWKRDMDTRGIDYKKSFKRLLKVSIVDISPNHVGESRRSTRSVSISACALDRGDYFIRALIYHELGHFVFHLDHMDGVIMTSPVLTNAEYEEQWQEAVDEYLTACEAREFEAQY